MIIPQHEFNEDMDYLERVIRRPCPYCFDCLTYMQDHWYECDGFRVDNPGCIEYEKLVLQMINRYAVRYTPKFHCFRVREREMAKPNKVIKLPLTDMHGNQDAIAYMKKGQNDSNNT